MYKWIIFCKITSYISIQKFSSYILNTIGFSLGTYEGNVVGVILGKGMGCTLIETGGLPLV